MGLARLFGAQISKFNFTMEHKNFWIKILKRIQPTIQKMHFLTWLQNTTILEKDGSKIVVGVPSSYSKNWIEDKYKTKIFQAAQELDDSVQEISFKVEGKLVDDPKVGGVDVKAMFAGEEKKVRKLPNIQEVKVSNSQFAVRSAMLNDKYQLGNYVVGIDNRLPHAACQAVATMPGGVYNPLYIFGAPGLGKTHLLQAIGNQVLQDSPEKVIKYITAERFVTEIVEAIGKRYTHKFKAQFRNVDVFLLDDVQFFMKKESSQQEFFHTFNELYQNNKQVVLTSDRSPAELAGLDERLRSRFGMGMVVELVMPDFETRIAILQQKCQEFEMLIDPAILEFVANNVTSSVRELEGVLRQIMAEFEMFQTVPTIRSVAEILQKMNKARQIIGFETDQPRGKIVRDPSAVMSIVAEYFNVTVEDMTSAARHKTVNVPRQVCMYIIKNELGESYEKIGMGFGGRNHTTVMHACSKTAKQLKKDLRLVRDVNAIKREMGL